MEFRTTHNRVITITYMVTCIYHMIGRTGRLFVSLGQMVPVLFQQHTDYFMKIYGKEEQFLIREAIFILGMF